jgi:hypothetical protein
MTDASTLAARTIRDYTRYLDDTDYDWIDYEQAAHLDPQEWLERENPTDPDIDA